MATLTARLPSVFRSSSFARFYAGQCLSYLGDGLRMLAIPLIVFHLTGSGVALGVTWGLELIPYAFVSLIGGSAIAGAYSMADNAKAQHSEKAFCSTGSL